MSLIAMTDEKMKLLTLDRCGAFNLDKWWKEMDELELRGGEEEWKNVGRTSSRKNGGEGGGRYRGTALVAVRVTGHD